METLSPYPKKNTSTYISVIIKYVKITSIQTYAIAYSFEIRIFVFPHVTRNTNDKSYQRLGRIGGILDR